MVDLLFGCIITFMPDLDLNDPCPCEGGKLFRSCCYLTNFKPAYAVTRPPAPKTGISKPGCYASAFNDCSEKMSREHFISKSILEILNKNNNMIVTGLPWMDKGKYMKLHPNSLTGKILCRRHNEALSPLDQVALRFFKTLIRIEEEFADKSTAQIDRIYLFNGHDIERWILKTLCGSVFSGNSSIANERIKNWIPNITWLNMLFGTQRFPPNCGMFYNADVAESLDLIEDFKFSPVSGENQEVLGGNLAPKNHSFILLLVPYIGEIKGSLLEHYAYRPTQIAVKSSNGSGEKVIVFAYDVPTNENRIEIKIDYHSL